MKSIMLSKEDVISILKNVAKDMHQHIEELRNLDSVLGDGDLGVTVELASKSILDFFNSADSVIKKETLGTMLINCGFNINKASPSTFGTLLAFAFISAGNSVKEKYILSIDDLIIMGKSSIKKIKGRGHADVGDKTMLDSLVPAVEIFDQVIRKDKDFNKALGFAVKAAKAGAEATKNMEAKHSRASLLKKRGIGIQDGGAIAIYYFISNFAKHLSKIIN